MIRTILVLGSSPIDTSLATSLPGFSPTRPRVGERTWERDCLPLLSSSHVIQVSPAACVFVREPLHGYRKRRIYAGLHHLSGTHFEAHVEICEISLLHEFAYGQLLLSCVEKYKTTN